MKRIFLLLLLFCTLNACDSLQTADLGEATVDLAISRAAENLSSDVSMKTAFLDTDAVGIFADGRECKWTFAGGVWNAESPFFWSDENEVFFNIYYPYTSGSKLEHVPMPGLTGQCGKEIDVQARDFICGGRSLSFADNNGKVEFFGSYALEHQYSLLVLRIRSAIATAMARITQVDIEGASLFNPSYYSFVDRKVHVSTTDNNSTLSIPYQNFPDLEGRNYLLFKILVNPLTLDKCTKVTVHYLFNDVPKMVSTENLTREFKSGYYYQYDILVNTIGELTVTGAEVNGRREETCPDTMLPR